MFNLLAVRGAAIPRLTRLINDPQVSDAEKMAYQDQLFQEKTKAERGDRENALRRHNLLPAVFALLTAMGKSGKMGEYCATQSSNVSLKSRGNSQCSKSKRKGEEGEGCKARARTVARSTDSCSHTRPHLFNPNTIIMHDAVITVARQRDS
jgi:hypothetical protein